ncbi:MAG TPA: endonuclease [Planctomycetes bacterium]|nr:endonuclease [Planctomycetota bacterium]
MAGRKVLALLVVSGFALSALGGCSNSSSSKGGFASTTAASTSSTPSAVSTASTSPTTTAAPVTSAATLASGRIKLLTYNVAGLPQGISGSDPARNTPLISPKLNDYHLVLVQEDFWFHDALKKDATHPHQSAHHRGYTTPVGDGLNRFSIWPFRDHSRLRWSDCNGWTGAANDCLSSKGFSFAIHELAPGVELHVYNLHADAGSSTGDEDARAKNFVQLERWIAAFSAGEALIVAGDTNLKDGSQRPRDGVVLDDFLQNTGLSEVARVLGQPSMIDRIMYRSSTKLELTPVGWREATEFTDSSGLDLSDHPAIHVDFDYQEK